MILEDSVFEVAIYLCGDYGGGDYRDIKMWCSLFRTIFKKILASDFHQRYTSLKILAFRITRQIQNVISLFPQDPKPPNLVGCDLGLRGSHLPGHMSLWSCSHMMSLTKIKTLCLLFHKTYEHQTWHSGNLFLSPFGHMMSRDNISEA